MMEAEQPAACEDAEQLAGAPMSHEEAAASVGGGEQDEESAAGRRNLPTVHPALAWAG